MTDLATIVWLGVHHRAILVAVIDYMILVPAGAWTWARIAIATPGALGTIWAELRWDAVRVAHRGVGGWWRR